MQSARGRSYQPVWVGVGGEWWPALKFNVPEEITGYPQEKAILFGNREVPKHVTSLPSVQWKEGLKRGYAAQENVPPAFDLAMKQVEMFTMLARIPGDWPTTYIGLLDRSVALVPASKMSVADEFLEKLFSPDPDSKSLLQSFTNPQDQSRIYAPPSSMLNGGFRQQQQVQPLQWDGGVYMGHAYMSGGGGSGGFFRPDFLHGVGLANPNGAMHGPCFTQCESKPIVINQRKRRQSGNPMEGPSVKRPRSSTEAASKQKSRHPPGSEEQKVVDMVENLTGAPFVKPGSMQLGRGGYRIIRRERGAANNRVAGGSKFDMENEPPLSWRGDDSGGGQGLQAVLHDVYEIVLGRGVPKNRSSDA
ncbi:hypothetical protein BSKO_05595 [Bryopsis sp. KO-2023]|nr:hypothetical protein BSKO_05595 [Bryopsis sp. KO-2023]